MTVSEPDRTTAARWNDAQRAERTYWSSCRGSSTAVADYLARLADDASWLSAEMGPVTGTFVELGIGPWGMGLIHLVGSPRDRRWGVDPLPLDPQALDGLSGPLAAAIERAQAMSYEHHVATGEEPGLPGIAASLVVLNNVLDHVRDPAVVIRNAASLLAPDGYLFLACDYFSSLGRWKAIHFDARRLSDSIYVRAHPFRFNYRSLEAILAASGLAVVASRDSPGVVQRSVGRERRARLLARLA